MKILVLVVATKREPWAGLMQAQMETWAAVPHPNVDTVFYYHGADSVTVGENYRALGFATCPDKFNMMHLRFKHLLDRVGYTKYDYIFRTNVSSYINKELLCQLAANLPRRGLYAGWLLGWLDKYIQFEGQRIKEACISGAGIWLTPDTAAILHAKLRPVYPMPEDDVIFGRVLLSNGIRPRSIKQMVSIAAPPEDTLPKVYHYRFKTVNRDNDIVNMKIIHQLI